MSAALARAGSAVLAPWAPAQLLSLSNFSRGFAGMSPTHATGINIEKKGEDPPLKADAELPHWLWALAAPGRTLAELRRAGGGGEELALEELQRVGKLENREKIRTRNVSKAK